MKYDVGNLSPGFGQAQTCGMLKPDNGMQTLPLIHFIVNFF
jgi:hypothetical protein